MSEQCMSHMFGGAQPQLCEALERLKKEHGPLRERMNGFAKLAEEMIHAEESDADPSRMETLIREVNAFIGELDPHSEREEGALFPMMARYIGKDTGPIAVMEYEHHQAKQYLKQFQERVQADAGTGNADSDWEGQAAELAVKAHAVLTDHFMKEENVLFPMAQNILSEEEKSSLLRMIEN